MARKTILGMSAALALCAAAVAATGEERTTTDANGITWNYILRDGVAVLGWETSSTPATTAGGDLEIPPALDGYPVGVVGKYSFYNCKSVTSIVIPSSVTNVAESAIYRGLTSLTNLVIPASVKTVGDRAFDFYDSKNVTVRIESMKAWCEAERTGSSGNPMVYAKRTYFGTEAVQDSGDLVIPEGTERIGSCAFDGSSCNNVTNIVIPSSVKEIGRMAFANFRNLKTIVLPPSVQKLGSRIFGSSTSLQLQVILPADFPLVENLAGAFSGVNLQIDEANPNYRRVGDGIYSRDGTVFLMAVKPSSVPTGYTLTIADTATCLADGCCNGLSWITAVTMPDGVTNIGASAFANCSGLTNVHLSASLRTIGDRAFSGCRALKSIELPEALEEIGSNAFGECSGLTNVHLSASLRTIGDRAFWYCSALKSIKLPEALEVIGRYAFERCAVAELVVPDSVTNAVSFSGCVSLTNVVIGKGVPRLQGWGFGGGLRSMTVRSANTVIESWALDSCSTLERLSVPSGIDVNSGAFSGEVPSALTLAIADWTRTFDGNYLAKAPILKKLATTLEVPPSCESFDPEAVKSFDKLTKIVFYGDSVKAIGYEAIRALKDGGFDVVYIPEGGTAEDGAAFLERFLIGDTVVKVISAAVRADDPDVLDVKYVITGAPETFAVRSLVFQDGERSFAKAIRPTSFLDGTVANANGTVAEAVTNAVAWKISDDWDANLGSVVFEVMTVESAELPLRFMTVPATANHRAMRFACITPSDAKVLDALFWHAADPNGTLTLRDGRLYDGETLLAEGTAPTAAGAVYVIRKMGYGLMSGEELAYVNKTLRLDLKPDGLRQYAVEYMSE